MPLRDDAVPRAAAFLTAYRATGSITRAAKAAKVDRGSHYDWLKSDDYAAQFAAAQAEVAQMLEDEALRRAHDGVIEPVIHQGQLCYPLKRDPKTGEIKPSRTPLTVRKYSDSLLQFLLRAFNPTKYRDSSKVEISGSLDLIDRLAAGRARVAAEKEKQTTEQ